MAVRAVPRAPGGSTAEPISKGRGELRDEPRRARTRPRRQAPTPVGAPGNRTPAPPVWEDGASPGRLVRRLRFTPPHPAAATRRPPDT
ncbi:hypothetical protein E4U91_23655 [Streptomyces lasalocidi]|uniref:Uncharacterized protein n=1 Tax=Streptomyces lasalocidi TaxID=324833 RepID=A0A4V6AWA0_STRLS|nr:hypothetical protein E4U91_23655 [Streptomyces lasalocidi]